MDHLLCGISLERLSARCVRHLADRWGADLTSKADEYRAKARECQKHAEQTRDPFIKQQLLENIHLIRLNSKFATNGPWGELMGALDL
jgi:hypothetical protein